MKMTKDDKNTMTGRVQAVKRQVGLSFIRHVHLCGSPAVLSVNLLCLTDLFATFHNGSQLFLVGARFAEPLEFALRKIFGI